MYYFCTSLFVHFLFQFTASDCRFGIFKRVFHNRQQRLYRIKVNNLPMQLEIVIGLINWFIYASLVFVDLFGIAELLGIIPELNVKFNTFSYTGKNTSGVYILYIFTTLSSPYTLLFLIS